MWFSFQLKIFSLRSFISTASPAWMKRTASSKSSNESQTMKKSTKSSLNNAGLFSLDQMTEKEWFDRFNGIEEKLTKLFVLIAIMRKQGLITSKECSQFKEFIIRYEEKANHSLATFEKSKSLFSLRSELRGRLDLPRQRKTDCKSTVSIFSRV